MADTKITALSAITTVDPANDVLPIVDVSDTSMAASGTTKKITTNQILGASGTATLASATITGDLTVDTSTLKVDSANNRVGINTASPAVTLDVNGASNLNGNITIANGGSPFGTMFVTGSALELQANSNSTNGLSLKTTSTTPIIFSVNSAEAMRLNSTGLGVGVTPSAWNNTYNVLDIGQNGSISGRTSTNNSVDIVSNGFRNSGGTWVYKLATSNAASRYLIDGATGGHLWYSGAAGTAGNTIAGFSTATMTLDASGRLILLASTTTPATLSTNGQLTFTATSDTNLRFSYRGSDGVTRVANITLA